MTCWHASWPAPSARSRTVTGGDVGHQFMRYTPRGQDSELPAVHRFSVRLQTS
jgi:hypothetical protein